MILMSDREKAYKKMQYKLSLARNNTNEPFLIIYKIEHSVPKYGNSRYVTDNGNTRENSDLLESILCAVKNNIHSDELCEKWSENEFVVLLFDVDISKAHQKAQELSNLLQKHKHDNMQYLVINHSVLQMIPNGKLEYDLLHNINKTLQRSTKRSYNHIHYNHWGL